MARAIEVASGVHALEVVTEFAGEDRTYYPTVVETPRGPLLVDATFADSQDELAAALADAGLSLAETAILLLTHQDADHAGGAQAVRDRADPLVTAHEAAAPYIDGRRALLKAVNERYPPVETDVALVDGVTFRTRAGPMAVVHAPGHAPGHVSLHLPEAGVLLAGDALTAEAGLAGPKPEYTPEMGTAKKSAHRLAELGYGTVVCFHGGPVEATGSDVRDVAASL